MLLMSAILVEHLKKTFRVPLPARGSWVQKFKNYLYPQYQTLRAVDGISFQVQAGERVAFIGPNGAGKSTTIKILTGIMRPTSGQVRVLDKIPGVDRKTLTYQ